MKKGGCVLVCLFCNDVKCAPLHLNGQKKNKALTWGSLKVNTSLSIYYIPPKKSPLVKNKITSTNSWISVTPCCLNTIV